MTITRVHVNQHVLRRNLKDGISRPVYTVKQGGRTVYAHAVRFTGPVELIDPRHRPPLPCGARLWLETKHPVILVDPCTFADLQDKDVA